MSNLSDSIKSGAIDQLKTTNELLEQQVLELKGVVSSQKSRIRMLDRELNLFRDSNLGDFTEKAKAWDDLEDLVSKCNSDRFDFRISLGYISVTYYGDVITTFSEKFSKEAVSNALESIKGE